MQAKKLEIQKQLDHLYVQLEEAHIAFVNNQSVENETLIKKFDTAIDELIDVLIEMDEQRQ
jgi:hypothetical protein